MPTLTVLSLLTLALLAEEPATATPHWTSGDTTIELIGTRQADDFEYLFELRTAQGEPAKRMLHAKELTLEKAWIGPDDKLLVQGRSNLRATHLLIGRPGQDGNDWIITWKLALSPSGNLLALQRFVPAHGPVPSDLVTIYDLRTSAAANDFSNTGPVEGLPWECIGRIVYGESAAFRRSCAPDMTSKDRRLVSPFLWSQKGDREKLFFLVQEEDQVFLIRTQLPTPEDPVVLWRQQVDLRGRYHPDPGNDLNFKNGLKFLADALTWTPEGKITAELDPIYGFGSSFEIEPE